MENVYPGVVPVLVSVSADQSRLLGSAVCAHSSEQHVSCTTLGCVSLPSMGCSLQAEGRASTCNLLWICYWPLSVFPSLAFRLPVFCLLYPWILLHDIQDTLVTELVCVVLLLSVYQDGQNHQGSLVGPVLHDLQMSWQLQKQEPKWLFFPFRFSSSALGCHRELECPIRGLQWVLQAPRTSEAPLCDLGCPRLWWKQQENAQHHSKSSSNRCSSRCNSSSRPLRTGLGGECSGKKTQEDNWRKQKWYLFSSRS